MLDLAGGVEASIADDIVHGDDDVIYGFTYSFVVDVFHPFLSPPPPPRYGRRGCGGGNPLVQPLLGDCVCGVAR